jgi:hypothetical protein
MDDLYWYEEYVAYLSRSKFYVSMSKMTNGDVVHRIFTTRCNRPRCDLMILYCADRKVRIVSEGEYCKANPGVAVDHSMRLSLKSKSVKLLFCNYNDTLTFCLHYQDDRRFRPSLGLLVTSRYICTLIILFDVCLKMHVIYRKYNMPDSQLKAKGYLTAPVEDCNNGDVTERRQPDRLTPEKARTKK